MSVGKLLVGNDLYIELFDLEDADTGVNVTSGTVQCKVYERSGFSQTGETITGTQVGDTVTMTYDAGDTTWRGVLPGSTAIVLGTEYYVVVTADDGAGANGQWALRLTAELRGGD